MQNNNLELQFQVSNQISSFIYILKIKIEILIVRIKNNNLEFKNQNFDHISFLNLNKILKNSNNFLRT